MQSRSRQQDHECTDSIDRREELPALEKFLCPVDEAARIMGQKWTLQIVHHLLDGRSRRFCELQEILGKVNPSTLSSRLKMLEETGLVRRSQISNIPPHVEYSLTEMGEELRGVITEITRWSNTFLCMSNHRRKSAPSKAPPALDEEVGMPCNEDEAIAAIQLEDASRSAENIAEKPKFTLDIA
jgi:DNA-binding HxlR family transcriptional regulator